MIYSIVIYLIFVLPVSIKAYKRVGNKWLFIKIFNSLLTLYVFVLFGGNAKRLIFSLVDDEIYLMNDVSIWIKATYFVIYGAASIFAVIQVIKLAIRKESARGSFLRIIPLLWLLTCIDKYYAYIAIYDVVPSHLYLVFSNIIYGVVWGGIFIFYSNKKVKEFLLETI
jgi:hypothetical protein